MVIAKRSPTRNCMFPLIIYIVKDTGKLLDKANDSINDTNDRRSSISK